MTRDRTSRLRAHSMARLLALAAAAGCTSDYDVAEEMAIPRDTLTADTSYPQEPAPPPPDPDAQPSVLQPTVRVDTGRVARAVFGVAEIRIDSSTVTPADYVRVLLRGEGGTYETFTDRAGNYVFENVAAGKYELVFMSASKDARVLHTVPVLVSGEKAQLPATHIPVRVLRTRG